ncbi:sulfatase-like hydrolase/transferase [Catenovulum maritimum]|uniref:Sulfatase N-terminal domain-containing protein n=1 Tax=Catenovulum maritimum TaxID=1513271 RepID=A0A0J8GW18_9ALTE|nr:sulfatase-like hydrolase/transferase [Catenovulum maritimum]KMT66957.1 hypothetical protein XM47_02345 [Catenovulum maritimum]
MTKLQLKTLVLFACVLSLCACSLKKLEEKSEINPLATSKLPPNILWIVTDDHRPDSINAYNRAVYKQNDSPLGYVESPNTDKLAAEGILFTNAFTDSPVCAPSRAAMHSGRYPFRHSRLALYDLSIDSLERNNLAYQTQYTELAQWIRHKLGNIVLGDGRIEADWSQENHYVVSNIAKGADDKKLDIPAHLINNLPR